MDDRAARTGEKVTDSLDPRLDVYARLTEHELRSKRDPAEGVFIAESTKVIRLALDAGYEPLSLVTPASRVTQATQAYADVPEEVPLLIVDDGILETIAGFAVTRGELAAFRRPAPLSPEEVLGEARRVAVLDALTDATNVGALLRSAAALGIDAVVLSPTCADPLIRRTIRVSMGTALLIPWVRFEGTQQEWESGGMEWLRSFGLTTAATDLTDDAVAPDDPRVLDAERLAVVFGTEGEGSSDELVGSADLTICIPMARSVDSLNVAAMAAIVFWEIGR